MAIATDSLAIEIVPANEPVPTVAPTPQPIRRRVELGSTLIDHVDFNQAVERLRRFVLSGRPHQVVTANLDFLSIAEHNPEFREIVNTADLVVADGMPLVWLSRLRGEALRERVAGVELVEACCELAVENDRGVFLLGAGPGVAQRAARQLQARYPGLRIVGAVTPPMGSFKRKYNEQLVRKIREAQPAFLFVALGAPRQDLWIAEHLSELEVPVAMGVGCVFDLLAGVSNRAPSWMRAAGLEWSYRLTREPRRLWRRYLVQDLPLLLRLVLRSARTPQESDANAMVATT